MLVSLRTRNPPHEARARCEHVPHPSRHLRAPWLTYPLWLAPWPPGATPYMLRRGEARPSPVRWDEAGLMPELAVVRKLYCPRACMACMQSDDASREPRVTTNSMRRCTWPSISIVHSIWG